MASYLQWKGYSSGAPAPAAESSPDQSMIEMDDDEYSITEIQMEELGADELGAIQTCDEKTQSLRSARPTWSRGRRHVEAPTDPRSQWELDAETARLKQQLAEEERQRKKREEDEVRHVMQMVEPDERDAQQRQAEIDVLTERLGKLYGAQRESLQKGASAEKGSRNSRGLFRAMWEKTSNLGSARRDRDGQSLSTNNLTVKSKELEREAVTSRHVDPEEVDVVEVVSIPQPRQFGANLWQSPQSGSHFSVRNCSTIDVFVTMCENRPRRMLTAMNVDVSAAGGGGGIGLSPYNVPAQVLCLVHDKDHKEHLDSKKPQDSCPEVCFSWPKNKGALLSVEHDGKVYIGNIPVPAGAIIEFQEKFKLRIFAKRK